MLRIFPILVLWLTLQAQEPAQQIQLSTAFDGSILYLTAPFPRAGTNDPAQGRIYTITPAGISLYAERTREVLPVTGYGPQVTNYYSFVAAEVTSDGQILALSARRDCVSGRNCIGVPTLLTELSGAVELAVPNRVKFSPDGRWLLRFTEGGIGSAPGGLTDLATGVESPTPSYSYQLHPGTIVANSGSLVIDRAGLCLLPYLAQDCIQVTSLLAESAYTPNLSAEARTIVYSSAWNYPYHAYRRLRLVDLTTSQTRTIIEGFANYYQPVLSHDARRVLFLSDDPRDFSGWLMRPQAHAIDIDGRNLRRLTNDPSGIVTAILSGDGRVAYALSRSGRLLRLDIDSGLETELLPPFLQIFKMTALVAGSRVDIDAVDATDLRLFLAEKPVDLIRDAPGRFHFVLPFELAGQTVRLRAESSFLSGPFEPQTHDQEVPIYEKQPRAYDLPPEYGGPGAYGMRFSRVEDEGLTRLVTPFAPAGPGDVVNVLATGLGPVLPATGELETPLSCRWYSTRDVNPIQPLYAGLHPTEAGVYLLRFRIPELPEQMTYEGALQITCTDGGRFTNDPVILVAVHR